MIGISFKPCHCGSGLERRALLDARGIFCCFVCDKCEARRRSAFREDIFTDANYWTDEPVDPE
jgi:hypothetical protein